MGRGSYMEFEDLYKRFYRKSFLFTMSYIHKEMAAEDIASEVLIRLWTEIRRGGINNPDAFLLTLLKNRSLDYLKHEAVKEEAFSNMKTAHQEELDMRISMLESCDPEEVFTTEIQLIIRNTLATFPEQTQLIFEMSRFDNKTNKEIADKLKLSVKSVEYHITKVLKALRISLKDYLPLFYFFFFFK